MSNLKVKKKIKQNGKTRLNLRLPSDLDIWAKTYAHENNTTVTALIVGFFRDLKIKTERVEQF